MVLLSSGDNTQMAKYITVMDVVAMNQSLCEQAEQDAVLLDEGKLEAALMRAQMYAQYDDADLLRQAAVLISGVALAHAFSDANKRTALAAGTTFLILNGLYLVCDPITLGEQIVAILTRTDSEEAATARLEEWMRLHVQPFHG